MTKIEKDEKSIFDGLDVPTAEEMSDSSDEKQSAMCKLYEFFLRKPFCCK